MDTLNIDRCFIKDTPKDMKESAISAAAFALGHGLGLKVGAEGAEPRPNSASGRPALR